MTRRSLDDLAARAEQLADAFEDNTPAPGDRGAPLPPVMAVKLAAYRRDAAERELRDAVARARENAVPWRQLGEAIGTSGEAARQRYASKAS